MKKKIRMLKRMAYNDAGDVVSVQNEDDRSVYYYDSMRRWCYLDKADEGVDFEYVETNRGNRSI